MMGSLLKAAFENGAVLECTALRKTFLKADRVSSAALLNIN